MIGSTVPISRATAMLSGVGGGTTTIVIGLFRRRVQTAEGEIDATWRKSSRARKRFARPKTYTAVWRKGCKLYAGAGCVSSS